MSLPKSHILKKEKNCIRCCCFSTITIVTLHDVLVCWTLVYTSFISLELFLLIQSVLALEQCRVVYEGLFRQVVRNVNNSLYTVIILNVSVQYEYISHKKNLPSVCRPHASMEILVLAYNDMPLFIIHIPTVCNQAQLIVQ